MLQATCSQLFLLSLLTLLATASPTNRDKAISPDLSNTVLGVAVDKMVNKMANLTELVKQATGELVPAKCPHGGEYPECELGETTTEDVQMEDVQEEDVKEKNDQEEDVKEKS